MTPMTRLLKQRPDLCRGALAQTHDVNEAYLLVHHEMARALSRISDSDSDLGPEIGRELSARREQAAL